MLYDFKNGHTDKYFRITLGIQPVPVKKGIVKIIDKELKELINNGAAVITETEAYVIGEDGKRYDVFYYKSPFSFTNGDNPKFHITKCEAVLAHNGFRVSNSSKVDVIHRHSHKIHKGLVLELCTFCRNSVLSPNNTTEEFFNKQQEKHLETISKNEPIPTDFDGYTLDWSFVSKKYRQSKKYTCEECGINLENNKSYCDTHHLNGVKTHNTKTNLRCLCVLCHAHQDEQHIINFSKRKSRKRLESFIENFKDDLIDNRNEYLIPYLRNKKI